MFFSLELNEKVAELHWQGQTPKAKDLAFFKKYIYLFYSHVFMFRHNMGQAK